MSDDRRIIHEITPLMGKDVLYIADRHKKEFTYPIHNHSVFELNFVENAKGVRRIVGDSQEIIGDYDLCLITSPDLEHIWEQNDCRSEDIREITIQFDFSMSTETLFDRTQSIQQSIYFHNGFHRKHKSFLGLLHHSCNT